MEDISEEELMKLIRGIKSQVYREADKNAEKVGKDHVEDQTHF
jgi:hypothetical protein